MTLFKETALQRQTISKRTKYFDNKDQLLTSSIYLLLLSHLYKD